MKTRSRGDYSQEIRTILQGRSTKYTGRTTEQAISTAGAAVNPVHAKKARSSQISFGSGNFAFWGEEQLAVVGWQKHQMFSGQQKHQLPLGQATGVGAGLSS